MFSSRVPDDRRPNRLSTALSRARAGRDIINLTISNPTRAGIRYPPGLLASLGSDRGLDYSPDPFGLEDTRAAVAGEFERRGIRIQPDRVILTASTSEAYSILFKLLCDPGTAALTPIPSYPLFDHLTRLDGVVQRHYQLSFHGTWSIDFTDLDRVWSDDTRAVLAVTPNNPTGSVLTAADGAELAARCAERQAALILDEVFADYPMTGSELAPPQDDGRCLMFRLGGLSKAAGLPQVKLGWIGVSGPPALVDEALERLELICDTYLSVSTPVQLAARELIEASAGVRQQIRERVGGNYRRLTQLAASAASVSVLPVEAGWSAVLRVPAIVGEEGLALDLLDRGVVVHPGFFFDFPHEAFIVVSLLPEPAAFETGVGILLDLAHA
jgi:aspartate/methionine/tyrosine aminotransferase